MYYFTELFRCTFFRSLETRAPWIHLVPMPNLYRGEFQLKNASDASLLAGAGAVTAGAVTAGAGAVNGVSAYDAVIDGISAQYASE
jgi:hypothetical protein